MVMAKKLVTAEQLAKELSVGVDTIDNWGRAGRIPRIRISRKIVRYDRDAVLSALSQAGVKDEH
jgi:predicted site-specific integrase-resolvase